MFYSVRLVRDVRVVPKDFGPRLAKVVKRKLVAELEGRVLTPYGLVILVEAIEADIGLGRFEDTEIGSAVFKVACRVLVCRLFKGQIVDGVITLVSKVGVFAEAGPVSFFVSKNNMPVGFVFDSHPRNAFRRENGDEEIVEGDEIRVKVIGMKLNEAEGFFAVASIDENFLGLV